MARTFAIIFGVALIILGILGFLPNFITAGKLFGIFASNLEINMAHLVTGILGLLCGFSSNPASRVYFIVVGILYTFLAILGLANTDKLLLCMFADNLANNWLHAGISIFSLYVGLTCKN